MILASGYSARIARIASVPLRSGSRRSISVTSGLCEPEEFDRVTTRRRLGTHGHVRLQRDHTGQAETHEIVIVDEHQPKRVSHGDSPTRIFGSRALGTRHSEDGAAARLLLEPERPAHLVDALANAAQSEVPGRSVEAPVGEACTVVRTTRRTVSSSKRSSTSTFDAPECLMAFVSASSPIRSK